jgi:hypothetical protein
LAVSRVLKRLHEEDEDGVPVGVLVLRGLLELIERDFKDHTFRAFTRVAVDGCPVEYVANELKKTVGCVHTDVSRVRTCLKREFKALGLPLDEGKMVAADRAVVSQSEVTS